MRQAKNYCMIIDSLAGGGAERVVVTLAHEFEKLGHQCHIVCLENTVSFKIESTLSTHFLFDAKDKTYASPLRLRSSCELLRQLLSSLEAKHGTFEKIYVHLEKSYVLASRLNYNNAFFVVHNAVLASLQQKTLHPVKYWNHRRAIKALSGHHLITVSDGIKHELEKLSWITAKSIQRIYNPIDIEYIRKQADQTVSDIPLQPYIIHVGRFARQKRHDVLFTAFGMLGRSVDLMLLCHNQKKALKKANQHKIESHVLLPGFKDNPYPYIKHAQLLVLSSDYEGFGNVLIEALALRVPVVSTNCQYGPSEILTGDLKPFLAATDNPNALLEKMILALEDEAISQKIKAYNFDFVDPQNSARQYLNA